MSMRGGVGRAGAHAQSHAEVGTGPGQDHALL